MPPIPIPIDKAVIDRFRRLNYNWTKIAKEIGISTDTICRWRKATNYEDPLTVPDDEELDEFVSNVSRSNEKIGEVTMDGKIVAAGMKVTRSRLRDSVNRVDPEGREKRKRRRLKRREYNVT